jgi:hypothetical protein
MKYFTKKVGLYICLIVIGGIILICCTTDRKFHEGLDTANTDVQKCYAEISRMNDLKQFILDSSTIKDTDKDNLNTYVSQLLTSQQDYCQYQSGGNVDQSQLDNYSKQIGDRKSILINYVKNSNTISTKDKDKITSYFYIRITDSNTVTPTVVPTVTPTPATGFMSDSDAKWSRGKNWTPVPEFTQSAMAPLQHETPTLSADSRGGLGSMVGNTNHLVSNVQNNQSSVYHMLGQ